MTCLSIPTHFLIVNKTSLSLCLSLSRQLEWFSLAERAANS